jgi:hypothetical protein
VRHTQRLRVTPGSIASHFYPPNEIVSENLSSLEAAWSRAYLEFPDRLFTIAVYNTQPRPSMRITPKHLGEFAIKFDEFIGEI